MTTLLEKILGTPTPSRFGKGPGVRSLSPPPPLKSLRKNMLRLDLFWGICYTSSNGDTGGSVDA